MRAVTPRVAAYIQSGGLVGWLVMMMTMMALIDGADDDVMR